MRIVVAMSGGVDSSVAAGLLLDAGHDVIGLSMQLYDHGDGQTSFGNCCTPSDLNDARKVAVQLGIPHYILNLKQQFNQHVVEPFVAEYRNARTPIPCVQCNGTLKFETLVNRGRGFDASHVATGHYARVSTTTDATGQQQYRLRRGVDRQKDQSYYLFTLNQQQLAKASFPIGGLSKSEVRDYAHAHGLAVADKPDSHEICFVPDGKYARFIDKRQPTSNATGNILSTEGKVLGEHQGVHRYTVGQRRGLGLSHTTPLYVTELDAVRKTVTVGPRESLERNHLSASNMNWIESVPLRGTEMLAQVRSQHNPAEAVVLAADENELEIEFKTPQAIITPGQAVVLYAKDVVLGGGWIN